MWGHIDSIYRHSDHQPVAVFFQVRTLSDRSRDEVFRYLQSDARAWARANAANGDALSRLVAASPDLLSIEYYFYYVNDTGLVGHRQDIEFVFVLVPKASPHRCSLKIVVGAGHDGGTPNNVLVQITDAHTPASDLKTPVFVELGGHASIPDGPFVGIFEFGRDVNWHSARTWGLRDIVASTGTGFTAQNRKWMFESNRRYSRRFALNPGRGQSKYRLMDAAVFRALYSSLELRDEEATVAALDAVAREVGLPSPEVTDETLAALRTWVEDVCCEPRPLLLARQPAPGLILFLSYPISSVFGAVEFANRFLRGPTTTIGSRRHQPWRHSHYTDAPSDILKPWLFRDASIGRAVSSHGAGVYVALRGGSVSAFPWPGSVSFSWSRAWGGGFMTDVSYDRAPWAKASWFVWTRAYAARQEAEPPRTPPEQRGWYDAFAAGVTLKPFRRVPLAKVGLQIDRRTRDLDWFFQLQLHLGRDRHGGGTALDCC